MYNGGVSYKGDKALAQAALPDALQFSNMVRAMKTSAGLAELEKVFDLPGGGTVRVVDNAYVRHIYIDVEFEEGEEEDEEFEDLIIDGVETFIIRAPASGSWSTPPPEIPDVPPAMVSCRPPFETMGTDELNDWFAGAYTYDQPADKYYARHAFIWRGEDITLHAPCEYPNDSKYSVRNVSNSPVYNGGGDGGYDQEDKPIQDIYWQDHKIFGLTGDQTLLGFGINKETGWLVVGICGTTYDISIGEPKYQIGAAHNRMRFHAYSFTYPVKQGEKYISPPVVGTYQGTVGYEIRNDFQFGYSFVNTLGEGYLSQEVYTRSFGSLWYNFSPDGTKAVRVRTFAGYDPDTAALGDWTTPPNTGTFPTTYLTTYEDRVRFYIEENPADSNYGLFVIERTKVERDDVAGNIENTVTTNRNGSGITPISSNSETVYRYIAIDGWLSQVPVTSSWKPVSSGTTTSAWWSEIENDLLNWWISVGENQEIQTFVPGTSDIRHTPYAWPEDNDDGGGMLYEVYLRTIGTQNFSWQPASIRIRDLTVQKITSVYDFGEFVSTKRCIDGRRLYAIDYDKNGEEVYLYAEFENITEAEDTSGNQTLIDWNHIGPPVGAFSKVYPPPVYPENWSDDVQISNLDYTYTGTFRAVLVRPDNSETVADIMTLSASDLIRIDANRHLDYDSQQLSSGTWTYRGSGGQFGSQRWATGTNGFVGILERGGLCGFDPNSGTLLVSRIDVTFDGYLTSKGAPSDAYSETPVNDPKQRQINNIIPETGNWKNNTGTAAAARTDHFWRAGVHFGIPEIVGNSPTQYSSVWDQSNPNIPQNGANTQIPNICFYSSWENLFNNAWRVFNIIDSSMAVADAGETAFQIESYDLYPYAAPLDTSVIDAPIRHRGDNWRYEFEGKYQWAGPYCGAAAFVFHSGGEFTPLQEIMGVTPQPLGDDDPAFGSVGESRDTYALCSTITYENILEGTFEENIPIDEVDDYG